jgi:tetraacyldisaccharide 4'-kinase
VNAHKLIQAHLLKRSKLSFALYPLGKLYASVQAMRRRNANRKQFHAPCHVISIGNIVSGGSGKTPLTIALVRLLQANGLRVAVSHRGYKGEFEHKPHLISDNSGVLYPPETAGDEAYLIAASLPGIPVVVGRNRSEAITLLLKSYPATQVIIMDDAFQHLKVYRDLDIVTFAVETGLGNGFVLPAGYLREGLEALNKKNLAVIYSKGHASRPDWEDELAQRVNKVVHSYSTVTECVDPSGFKHPVQSLVGKRLVLVSGIAHPASFEATIKGIGISFSRHFAFPDHYAFNKPDEFESWLREIPDVILCTQKDLMKLARYPEIAPRLQAVVLDYHFEEPDAVFNLVMEYLS